MTIEQMFYIVIALQAADVISTLYAFRSGAVEANHFMKKLMDTLGTVTGLLLPKVIYGGLVWVYRDALSVEAVAVVAALYVAVVVNNVRVARAGKK